MKKLFGQKNKIRQRQPKIQDETLFKFKRSATFTGTPSNDVKSAAEDHSQIQSERLKQQKIRQRRRKMVLNSSIVVLILVFIGSVIAHKISSFDISITDNIKKSPSTTEYEQTLREFSGNQIQNNFTFSLDNKGASSYLQEKHPEIKAVTIKHEIFDSWPEVKISLRKPVLKWQTRNEQKAFYVDSFGKAFAFNAFGNDKELVHVNDESGVPAILGSPVISSRQITFLGQFVGGVKEISESSINVEKIVFPPLSTKQININIKNREYYIKVYLDRAAKAQSEQLVKSVKHLEAKGKEPQEYIDIRVAERAYVK